MKNRPADRAFEFEPSLFEPGVYFNIKCIWKFPGPTNEFELSLVFETGEFEQPKFDCIFLQNTCLNFNSLSDLFRDGGLKNRQGLCNTIDNFFCRLSMVHTPHHSLANLWSLRS